MDRKDDARRDGALDEDKSGEKFQRPRKEYENENERDEALEEELRNVQKGLLSKLYDGDKKEERIGATKKRRKSVDFDLKEEEENDDARSDGERSDISWGAKMGTYEDPAKRSRAVSSSPRREKQTTMAMNMEIEKETKEKMKKKILNETKCAAEEREQIEMVVVVMMMMMMMIVGAIQKKR